MNHASSNWTNEELIKIPNYFEHSNPGKSWGWDEKNFIHYPSFKNVQSSIKPLRTNKYARGSEKALSSKKKVYILKRICQKIEKFRRFKICFITLRRERETRCVFVGGGNEDYSMEY